MVEVRVDQGFSLHFLFIKKFVGSPEVSLIEFMLSRSMSKEKVSLCSVSLG